MQNNLMLCAARVAVRKPEELRVFGGDYDTLDGTGVRDYIHAIDLNRGRLVALDAFVKLDASFVVNRCTGQGWGVLDMVRSFEKASGKSVPYEMLARRPARYPTMLRWFDRSRKAAWMARPVWDRAHVRGSLAMAGDESKAACVAHRHVRVSILSA
ncbi:UDP-glucose 4-epimerase [Paraburkholderia sp. GAS334]